MKNGYKSDYHLEKKFFQFRDLRELLRHSSEVYGDKVAFISKIKDKDIKDQKYIHTTYKDLFKDLNDLGTAMLKEGMKGQRIAVIGENSYQWILAYMAIACGVGVTVPLDKGLQKEELESCISRAKCETIFYDSKHRDMIEEIMKDGNTPLKTGIALDFNGGDAIPLQDLLLSGEALIAAGDTSYTEAEIDPDVMSFLLFTSGTTQKSKAVMLSHRNLMSCNYGMNCEELFFPDDVNMLILPLHHIYGFGGVLIFLSQGLTNCFCDGLKYVAMNMKEYGVSVITCVPLLTENMYKKIIKAIKAKGMEDKVRNALKICDAADKVGINLRKRMFRSIQEQLGGKLRFLINGAAPLDPVVAKGFNDLGILTVLGYGLTETSPTIASETYRYIKEGSVGKFMPNIEYKLEDIDENGIGELCVRGEQVMLGYYEDQEATDEVIVDGWFHTGDLAYVDDEGYLFIAGRKKNVIVMKNGKNVFPEEIENLVNLLPYVDECMLFTRNKASDFVLWLKVVYDKSYLEDNGMTKEELEKKFEEDLEKINESMPQYKMVKKFYLSDRPTIKTTTQKTKRNDEMKQIEEELKELGLAK